MYMGFPESTLTRRPSHLKIWWRQRKPGILARLKRGWWRMRALWQYDVVRGVVEFGGFAAVLLFVTWYMLHE